MRCTCNSIRENSSGVSYSLAILGVECGYCEARNEEYEWQDRRAGMTQAERDAEDIATRWYLATHVNIRDAVRPGRAIPKGWF